jgi:hypothetical protein
MTSGHPPKHHSTHSPSKTMTGSETLPRSLDGEEVVYEWKEGKHKCIERRDSSGDVRGL